MILIVRLVLFVSLQVRFAGRNSWYVVGPMLLKYFALFGFDSVNVKDDMLENMGASED